MTRLCKHRGLGDTRLTRDRAVALLDVTDNLLADICNCEIAKAGEGKTLPGETSVRELFLVEWAKGSDAAAKAAQNAIKAGSGDISDREIAEVLDLVDDTLRSDFVAPVGAELPAKLSKAYKRGTPALGGRAKRAWQEIDDRATAWLGEHHMYWVGNYFDRQLSDAMAETVASGMREGLGREEIGRTLREFFEDYPGVGAKPDHYWSGMAANGINRSRQFGLVQGYVDIEQTALVIMAVMDERTSDICFAPWTRIATDTGDRRIDQISPGDVVLTGCREYRRVKATSSRISHSWISVRLSSGCILTVTPEHPILTSTGWKAAGALRIGDEIGLQRQQDAHVPTLRQAIQGGEAQAEAVLLSGMLPRTPAAEGLGHTDMYSLWQAVPGPPLLGGGRQGTVLQPQVPKRGGASRFEPGSPRQEMQDVRKGVQNQAHRVSFGEGAAALLDGMSATSRYHDLRRLREGIRVCPLGIRASQILLPRLLSPLTLGIELGVASSRGLQGIRDIISGRSPHRSLLRRLRSASLRSRRGGRWPILAWEEERNGSESRGTGAEGTAHRGGWVFVDSSCLGRSQERPGERSPEEYLRSATGTDTVVSIRRAHSTQSLPAHNLEVEGDPTYVAEGVIVHNCRSLNGRVIPLNACVKQRDALMAAEDPEDVKRIAPWLPVQAIKGKRTSALIAQGIGMPPYHFHCRTTVVAR